MKDLKSESASSGYCGKGARHTPARHAASGTIKGLISCEAFYEEMEVGMQLLLNDRLQFISLKMTSI
jgi:hypothetical protein